MAGSALLKLACAVVLCMVVVAPHAEAAVTCGLVASNISKCIPYLKTGGTPPPGCCDGVKSLSMAASNPADRKTACGCLKSFASAIKDLKYQYAADLPTKCGVKVPYPISPSTDCSKVQ